MGTWWNSELETFANSRHFELIDLRLSFTPCLQLVPDPSQLITSITIVTLNDNLYQLHQELYMYVLLHPKNATTGLQYSEAQRQRIFLRHQVSQET